MAVNGNGKVPRRYTGGAYHATPYLRHTDIYSTGNLAYIFEVSPATGLHILNRIPGAFVAAGTKHRRVDRASLIQFLDDQPAADRERRLKRLAEIDEARREAIR